ncbi:hypothetical protein HD806DRAFT_534822 [Xylariaceae sp. AK1471]|nr:hypothetical protein HD806DRAFT_534822 [Xylariaceae sp. AK1471]
MDFKSAKTRLRRTFAYPSDTTTTSTSPSSSPRHLSPDSDSDDNGPAFDEQEQEELILSLAQQNAARNAQFRLFLLALPALSTIPYFLLLFGGLFGLISRGSGSGGGGEVGDGRSSKRGTVTDIWTALLALSSLVSTAWTLWSLPPGVTGIRPLDAWVGSSNANPNSHNDGSGSESEHLMTLGPIGANAQRRRRYSGSPGLWLQHRSPLEQYLPFLNMALCGVLVLTGFLSSQRSAAARQHWGHVGLANLPAVVYAVVLVAKMLMGSVDPERELSALRYEYKGA